MKTYPIYECLFLGSADCMCATTVRIAALNKRHATKKFLAIQNSPTNIIGPMGRWDTEQKRNVFDEKAVHRDDEIRATRIDYYDSRR